jgi:hypothetical protein
MQKKFKVYDGISNEEIPVPEYMQEYLNSIPYSPWWTHTNVFYNNKKGHDASIKDSNGLVILIIKNKETSFLQRHPKIKDKFEEVLNKGYDFFQYRESKITGGTVKGWFWVRPKNYEPLQRTVSGSAEN